MYTNLSYLSDFLGKILKKIRHVTLHVLAVKELSVESEMV